MPSYYNPPPLSSDVTYAAIPFRQPFPSIGQSIVLTFMLIGAQIFTGFVLGAITFLAGRPQEESTGPGLMAVGNILSFILVFGIALGWGKLQLHEGLPMTPVPLRILPPVTMTIIGLSPLLAELSNLVLVLLPPPDFMNAVFEDMLGADGQVWQSVILLCLIAPMTEEPLFRGLMLNGLLRRHRPWVAILVTAVLFAVMHINPWQFLPPMAWGLLFGWWFLRTRSLWPCIVGHAVNNSLPHVTQAIPGFDVPGYTAPPGDTLLFQPLWFLLAGLAAFLIGHAWTLLEFNRMPGLPVARPVEPPPQFPAAGS